MKLKRLAKDGTTSLVIPALRVRTSTVPAQSSASSWRPTGLAGT